MPDEARDFTWNSRIRRARARTPEFLKRAVGILRDLASLIWTLMQILKSR